MSTNTVLAEIITIGDELLIGQTVDTNSAFIGAELVKNGIQVHQITSIADERSHILKALDDAAKRVSIVLITGGLGPTEDDITKQTLCEYFDTEVEMVPEVLADIEAFFAQYKRPMLEVNRQQAALPKACTVLRNKRGTASGMWFEKNNVVFVSMPGVPHEMKGLMRDDVLPALAQRFETPTLVHKTVMTQGLGESFIAERIADWAHELGNKGMKLAYLPSAGQVRIRISALAQDGSDIRKAVDAEASALVEILGDVVYGYDDEKLWEVVGRALTAQGKTVSLAESCTGGYIGHLLTSVPGSSAYFQGGVVAYAYAVKTALLGVSKETLEKKGAVSQEVVEQMAVQARSTFATDYAIATSGVAGPDGGTPEKPVGFVWLAVAGPEGVESLSCQFGKHRIRNIEMTALAALDMLRKKILR